tara:strand:- start:9112 stop:9966 length:855 start_codon:yes stop_codon:yes gene_type:complete
MKVIKYFFESLFIYTFLIIGRLLGLSISRRIFSFIFKKIGPLIRSKKIINKNFKNFSKKITEDEKNKIISSMWANYGMTFIEYIFLDKFRKKNQFVKVDGDEIIKSIIENKKQVIFVSGHFANFELISMELTKRKINLATLYRPLNNFFLNPLMEYLREKYVCRSQFKKGLGGVKESIVYLKKGYSIGLMIDQRVTEGEKIKFFNDYAFTTTLPAQLSLKFNIDIVPVFIERVENERFRIKFYDPIKTNNSESKTQITRKLNKFLEDMIIKNPYQWIWTHNRWK